MDLRKTKTQSIYKDYTNPVKPENEKKKVSVLGGEYWYN
jgi:hypothetical protein